MKRTAIRKSFERHYHRNEKRAARYAALKRRAAASQQLQHDNNRLRKLAVRLQEQLDQSRSAARSEKDRAVKLGAEIDRLLAIKCQTTAQQNKYHALADFVDCMRQQPIDQALFGAMWALFIIMAKFVVADGNDHDVRRASAHSG
jgi:hypothetical protein